MRRLNLLACLSLSLLLAHPVAAQDLTWMPLSSSGEGSSSAGWHLNLDELERHYGTNSPQLTELTALTAPPVRLPVSPLSAGFAEPDTTVAPMEDIGGLFDTTGGQWQAVAGPFADYGARLGIPLEENLTGRMFVLQQTDGFHDCPQNATVAGQMLWEVGSNFRLGAGAASGPLQFGDDLSFSRHLDLTANWQVGESTELSLDLSTGADTDLWQTEPGRPWQSLGAHLVQGLSDQWSVDIGYVVGTEDDEGEVVSTSEIGIFPLYALDEDKYLKAGVTLDLSSDSGGVEPGYSLWGVFRF